MIRLIVVTEDISGCVYGNAQHSHVTHKTFDVEIPQLEQFLQEKPCNPYCTRKVIGVEVISEAK